MTTKESLMKAFAAKDIAVYKQYEHGMLIDKYCSIAEILLKEVFKDSYSSNMKVCNLKNHLTDVADQYALKKTAPYISVMKALDELGACIGGMKNGQKGELRVGKALETLPPEMVVLKNINLKTDYGSAEYDYIVISQKGFFIVEVKYSKNAMEIDELGNFKRADGASRYHTNIADSLFDKEYILYSTMSQISPGLIKRSQIHSVMVATGNPNINNRCEKVVVKTRGTICDHIVDYRSDDRELFADDLPNIRDSIMERNYQQLFELDIDVEKLASDFAALIMLIENSSANDAELNDDIPTEYEESDTNKVVSEAAVENTSSDKWWKYGLSTAAGFIVGVGLPKILKLIRFAL